MLMPSLYRDRLKYIEFIFFSESPTFRSSTRNVADACQTRSRSGVGSCPPASAAPHRAVGLAIGPADRSRRAPEADTPTARSNAGMAHNAFARDVRPVDPAATNASVWSSRRVALDASRRADRASAPFAR